jgi:hypothetical protein
VVLQQIFTYDSRPANTEAAEARHVADFCGRWIERMDGMDRTGTGLFSKKSLIFLGIV